MKLFYNSDGTVKVLPVSALPANTVWNGGFPYTPEGSLLVSIVSAKPTDTVSNGGFIQELWGGVCAGYDTPSIWIGGLAVTSYGALCLDVDGGIVTDGPVLYNSLTHSLIPTRGDITPSFTRATTSTWQNNDGYLVTGVAGEIGFVGARRVRNLVSSSDISTWSTTSGVAIGSGVTDPDGGTTAYTLTCTAPSGYWVDALASKLSIGVCVNSCYVRRRTGTGAVRIYNGATGSGTEDITAQITTEWTRIIAAATAVTALSGNFIGFDFQTAGDAIDVWHPQCEDVTAQTTQTAGEYVSVGVESAPYYHGSMVDGVKCFPTDLSGNPIPSTTMLGYQAQGARTNLCLQSNDPSNASWTKSSFITTTQNAVSPDGATNAWTIAATTGATFAVFLQNITVAADTNSYTASCFVKKTTGTPATYPMFELQHSSATKTAGVVINTTAGTLTNRSVGGAIVAPDAKTITSWNDDYWRVTVTLANNSGTTSTIAFYPSINSDGTGTIVSGTLGSAVFYGAQLELGASASSYIATTTIAVTRNADVESVSTSGNIAAAAGSIYLEYTPTHTPSGTIALWGTYVDASNYTAILHDATNLIFRKRIAGVNYDATIANAFVAGTTYKACATWGAAGTSITLNGTEGTPHANTTAAQIAATMQWGADGNGGSQPFMALKYGYIGQRQLSASELLAITS